MEYNGKDEKAATALQRRQAAAIMATEQIKVGAIRRKGTTIMKPAIDCRGLDLMSSAREDVSIHPFVRGEIPLGCSPMGLRCAYVCHPCVWRMDVWMCVDGRGWCGTIHSLE